MVTPTVNEARSFPTMQILNEVHSKCRVRGRTEHHQRVNDEREQEPQRGGANRPQMRREDGLSQLLGRSHRGRREVGGGG